jgi:2-oxoisovalerate ferredoxin oxidoreductase beta subunit
MCELIDGLKAPVFIERVAVSDIKNIRRARRAVRKAMQIQKEGKGYTFVEVLTSCPTNLKRNAVETNRFVNEEMAREFPLKNFRDLSAEVEPVTRDRSCYEKADIDREFGLDVVRRVSDEVPALERELKIKVAGFGGQGVLSLGIMLTQAAQMAGHRVSWFPSYGPEQRGGTSNCSVVMSGEAIGSPVVSRPDVLIAMNQPSLERFQNDMPPGGMLLYEANIGDVVLPEGVRAAGVPAYDLGVKGGSERAANVAMLGVLMESGVTGLPAEAFTLALEESFEAKPKLIPLNRAVFELGREWARENL